MEGTVQAEPSAQERRGRAAGAPKGPAASPAQKAYFDGLHSEAMRAYAIAKQARRKGKDPSLEVEIPPAEDLAARVEAQVGPVGVAERIREATKEIGNREIVSLRVASEVAADLLAQGQSREKCLDQAVRTGLSILTEGVLVAPLEGIADVKIGANHDGTDYVDLYFAGPIRAAGGTGQAMSVLIADVVRRELKIGTYVPTDGEVERYKEEIPAYKQQANLQYTPTGPEIELIARNCPVCINGEGTEQEEVTGNRDLPRVESNRLRGGACLVMAEGLVLKAPKLMKHIEKLGLEGWDFLGEFMKKGKSDDEDGEKDPNAIPEIPPNYKFVRDIIAGRPVFGHPSRKGAFRLRYGRSRTGGLASTSVHPATMALVDDFLAVGTQIKVERPGKGTLATPCDELDPPTVMLRNGSVIPIRSIAEVKELRPAILEILDLGEMLVPFGEFAENNHLLPHASYCWEWWVQEFQAATGTTDDVHPAGSLSGPEMVRLAEETGTPLHPDGTLLWHDLEPAATRTLGELVRATGRWDAGALVLPAGESDEAAAAGLTLLADLLCHYTIHLEEEAGDVARVEPRLSYPLVRCLGLDVEGDPAGDGHIVDTPRRRVLYDPCQPDLPTRYPTVALVERLSGLTIRPKAPARIGGRMGRPEKADVRKMQPPPHGLFPIGGAGGNQRQIRDAAAQGSIEVEVGERLCAQCGRKNWRTFCECGGHTEVAPKAPRDGFEREMTTIKLREELERARAALSMGRLPAQVKGVVGVINKDKVPEPLEKALLRAKHGLWVFKDGTVRYDMTDVPVTHFRPAEVHAPVERLREIGYTTDIHGEPLERDDQVLELRVQDIVVSNGCMDYFIASARYIDELLVHFYGLKPFYNVESRDDLLGALTIGLAPHTSGGALCRIVGWTKAQVHYGHPYFHAAKRRNCLPPNAEIWTLNSPAPVRRDLASIWNTAPHAAMAVDATGTEAKTLAGIRVLATGPDGSIRPRKALRVYRVPAPAHLLTVKTRSGRHLRLSPHHPVVTGHGLSKRAALSLQAGDHLAFATRIPVADTSLPDFDLWRQLELHPVADVMVRGAGGWIGECIAGAGGLSAAAARLGVAPKLLDQYRRRDSVPEPVARQAEQMWSPLPADVRLAAQRDTVELPRTIRATPDLARLAGHYLAQGHLRRGAVHQVDFAASEADQRADMLACIQEALGLEVSAAPTRVTVSGRLVAWLFAEVMKLGAGAHDKSVPTWAAGAPPDFRRQLLRALFSGDGRVETGRLHVSYHTVSRSLLRDIQAQLASFGIAARIRQSMRPAGGAVGQHAERTGRPAPVREAWSLHIRSTDAACFATEVGFSLARKQDALERALPLLRGSRLKRLGDVALDEVLEVRHEACTEAWLYDLEVEEDHTFLAEDLMVCSNCDGDEDAVMLLMDGLLNFSRHFVPDRRGGLMDLPLVLTTRLDPNEVDKEAHNVDTLWRYPLAFFEATTRHAHPKDVDKIMGMVADRVGKPEQYEGFGYTHDTRDIAEGPAASAYKTLGSMMDKMTAQMELGRKLRAVDEADVGAKVIGTHFLPDLMGNLKAFSKQKVRCPQCNAKYRRMPLKGVCLACGNPKLTLTVHEGSVKKYLNISKEVAEKYNLDPYTKQRIVLLEQSVDSLFNNDKVRKAKLSDFF